MTPPAASTPLLVARATALAATLARPAARATVLAAVFTTIVTVYVAGSFHRNAWSLVDDHEVLSWIGERDRVPPSEFGHVLAHTEVLNRWARFRPVYYVARVAEATLFGKDVVRWYAVQFFFHAASVFLLAYAAVRYLVKDGLEALVALSGVALVVSRSYWTDMFGRLGPSESFGILASSLALLAFLARFAGGDRRAGWYGASIAGTLIAAGSKENLLVLAVPLAALTILDWRRLAWPLRAALLGALLLLVADGAWVVRIVSDKGKDIYFNSAALGDRLALVASFLRRPEVVVTIVGAVAVTAAARAWRARRPGEVPPGARQLTILGATLGACVALAATQYLFYAGKLPAQSRYDFPYVTAFDAALVASVIVALRLVRTALWGRRLSRPAVIALAGVAAAALGFRGTMGLREMRGGIAWWRTVNRIFDARIARAAEYVARTPGASVVLYARRGHDYEPVMSVQRHLLARSVSAPIFLTIASGADELSANEREATLLADMKAWSERGMERIRPLSQRAVGACFGFGFNGPPPEECASGAEAWPLDCREGEWIE